MTIVEQLKAVAAERDTLKASVDTASAALTEMTAQLAAAHADVEAGKLAIAELATVKASIADKDAAINAAGAKIDEQAKQIADLTAKLTHAPGAYADATNGTTPLAVAAQPADSVHIFSRAEIAKMSRADYAKNRKAILEQMAKGQVK